MRYLIKVTLEGDYGLEHTRLQGTGNFRISWSSYNSDRYYADYINEHNSYRTLAGAQKALEKIQKLASSFKSIKSTCELYEIGN